MCNKWQDIETAPKWSVYKEQFAVGFKHHCYGPWIIVFPAYGTVANPVGTARWWFVEGDGDHLAKNFLDPGGNVVRPSHWQPLPDPPSGEA